MRFTWLANAPWTYTGYGTQTALFTPRLQALGHDIAVIANWGHEGAPINWGNVQVFGRSFHPFALDIMYGHSRTWKADALITLMDTWVFTPDDLKEIPWIPWYPVDMDPIPQAIVDKLKRARAIIAMSKYGKEEAQKTGFDPLYVPLGIDTNIYKPKDMAQSREDLQLPPDKYIIGMVAMNKGNPSRKAFHQTIAAFAELKKKHADAVLYLHTFDGKRNDGNMVDLVESCRFCGLKIGYHYQPGFLEADVIFADQYRYALGYPPEIMATLYSAMDVFSLVTMGEGFGIPIIEAQACGTPVIVGDWTSMPELCGSGWKVSKDDAEPLFTNLSAFHYLPKPAAIAEKFEAAYRMRGNQQYRKRARKFAMNYDADRITEKYWKPALVEIEKALTQKQPDAHLEYNLGVLR